MYDRVANYPGRISLIPVEGQDNVFEMARADGAVEPGTPLNKATLLTDATAALVGLDESATPDDVFAILANAVNKLNPASLQAASDIEALQDKTTSMKNTISDLQSTLNTVQTKTNGLITYGTSALTAGTSNLTTGYIYVQYE